MTTLGPVKVAYQSDIALSPEAFPTDNFFVNRQRLFMRDKYGSVGIYDTTNGQKTGVILNGDRGLQHIATDGNFLYIKHRPGFLLGANDLLLCVGEPAFEKEPGDEHEPWREHRFSGQTLEQARFPHWMLDKEKNIDSLVVSVPLRAMTRDSDFNLAYAVGFLTEKQPKIVIPHRTPVVSLNSGDGYAALGWDLTGQGGDYRYALMKDGVFVQERDVIRASQGAQFSLYNSPCDGLRASWYDGEQSTSLEVLLEMPQRLAKRDIVGTYLYGEVLHVLYNNKTNKSGHVIEVNHPPLLATFTVSGVPEMAELEGTARK